MAVTTEYDTAVYYNEKYPEESKRERNIRFGATDRNKSASISDDNRYIVNAFHAIRPFVVNANDGLSPMRPSDIAEWQSLTAVSLSREDCNIILAIDSVWRKHYSDCIAYSQKQRSKEAAKSPGRTYKGTS